VLDGETQHGDFAAATVVAPQIGRAMNRAADLPRSTL
jgi:hypothetical protein